MAALQKLHALAGRIDPVVKWADKRNLTPSMMYPPDKPVAEKIIPVTAAGKAAAGLEPTIKRKRASQYLGGGSGLFGGGG
jgi:hypothetical protein